MQNICTDLKPCLNPTLPHPTPPHPNVPKQQEPPESTKKHNKTKNKKESSPKITQGRPSSTFIILLTYF